ncbi:lipoprotein-releasing ABC transporter permease subunit LolE [Candidatus Profftia sp. (ex Adelges kitamiensis)]|uniref:lipoprotein-releasing ABC transporter permease subunit LolE n=1 Tax=Candidatus Profftia sp. (ex Adelges kitamiensis) TaxID=2864218 RepID=UPI001CE34CE5|nr:lipoprotein-releasing ABC transporter permease subunit LolE [Candidatus Profftia sp. (ex Adelges kitamiensis)]
MSFLPLSLIIGLKFSSGRNRGCMVSFILIISIISIALSVAVFIIGLSAMNGFERELDHRIISVVPHGEIYLTEQPLTNWVQVLKSIEKLQGIVAASPYVEFPGLLENGTKLVAVKIRGVNPKQERLVSSLSQYVIGNSWSKFIENKQQIILGRGIAKILNVQQGDWVTMIVSNQDPKMRLLRSQRISLYVSGILNFSGIIDHHLAMVPLIDAQNYFHLNHSITGIAIKVKDIFNINQLLRDVSTLTDSTVYLRSWKDSYGYMFRDIQMIRAIIYLSMAMVISVACFSIISTLVMAIKDKRSSIAVLRTLGATDKLISTIFIWYGLLSGIVGSICGIIIGVVISLQLTSIYLIIEKIIGYNLLSSDIYPINFLPTELHWINIVEVLCITITLSLLASWYPARSASRIDPVCVLHGN